MQQSMNPLQTSAAILQAGPKDEHRTLAHLGLPKDWRARMGVSLAILLGLAWLVASVALAGCGLTDRFDDGGGTSGQGGSTAADPSATGPDPSAGSGAGVGSSSGGGVDGTGGSSSGALECNPPSEPYTACDRECGSEACGAGLRCIGDTFGYSMCVSRCETVEECAPVGWAAPNDVVICQPTPTAVHTDSSTVGQQGWCWPPCEDVGSCPEIDGEQLECASLGGESPVCVWPSPES